MIDGALPEKNRHVDDELDPVTLTRSSSRVHSDDTYFNGNEWHSAVVNDGHVHLHFSGWRVQAGKKNGATKIIC